MDKTEAITATRHGAIAACISGSVTLALFVFATYTDADGEIGFWNDPAIIIDVILIFACAYGVYRKSRFAAVLLFVYFIFARVAISLETGQMSGIALSLVFLFFYGRAIWGAFAYHRIEKAENPEYKTSPKWILVVGAVVAILLLGVMGLGLLSMSGTIPSTAVQAGAELPQTDKDELVANGILSRDERIEYFYSYGLISILEGGSVLTERRVVVYFPNEDQELEVYALDIGDVVAVDLIEQGGAFTDSVYRISTNDPDAWLQIVLSAENGGDQAFVRALRSKIEESNSMTRSLPDYEQSLQLLRERGILADDESPPQPLAMPEPDDEGPLGLSFYRMGFENGADLSGLSIARTFFGRSEIAQVSFRGSDLRESNLRWNDFIDVDFTDASLASADLRASEYLRVLFDGADLSGADLRLSNFQDCSFRGANMTGSLLAEDQRSLLNLDERQMRQVSWQPDHGQEPAGG